MDTGIWVLKLILETLRQSDSKRVKPIYSTQIIFYGTIKPNIAFPVFRQNNLT